MESWKQDTHTPKIIITASSWGGLCVFWGVPLKRHKNLLKASLCQKPTWELTEQYLSCKTWLLMGVMKTKIFKDFHITLSWNLCYCSLAFAEVSDCCWLCRLYCVMIVLDFIGLGIIWIWSCDVPRNSKIHRILWELEGCSVLARLIHAIPS